MKLATEDETEFLFYVAKIKNFFKVQYLRKAEKYDGLFLAPPVDDINITNLCDIQKTLPPPIPVNSSNKAS